MGPRPEKTDAEMVEDALAETFNNMLDADVVERLNHEAISKKIDPVCLMHGKRMSEHMCLYCCLCFKTMTPDECSLNDKGQKQDVCKGCAFREKQRECIHIPHTECKREHRHLKVASLCSQCPRYNELMEVE